MKTVKCPTCGSAKFKLVFTSPIDENGMTPVGNLLEVETAVLLDADGNLFCDAEQPGNRRLERIDCGISTCSFFAFGLESLERQVEEKDDTVQSEVHVTMVLTLEHRKAADLFAVLEDQTFKIKPEFPTGFKVLDAVIKAADQKFH